MVLKGMYVKNKKTPTFPLIINVTIKCGVVMRSKTNNVRRIAGDTYEYRGI